MMNLSLKVMSIYLRLEDCSFLLWFGVSACFLTSLAPPEAQERSKLQTLQWNLYWWSLIDEENICWQTRIVSLIHRNTWFYTSSSWHESPCLNLQKKRGFCWRQSCYLKNEYWIPWCFVTSKFSLRTAVSRK